MDTAVIFDMDGVIADSETFNIGITQSILRAEGAEFDPHYNDKFLGATHESMWTVMKEEFGLKEEIQQYIDRWSAIRKEKIKKESIKPIPGVIDLIRSLKKQGYKLAVASSSLKKDIMSNMDSFGITDCFETFISGSECENGKPDPEIYFKAAKAIGKEPADCVVIEDSTAGIRAAKGAGMRCIAYAAEGGIWQDVSLADKVVKEFSEAVVQDIESHS